jgi:hypothetical protein
MTSAVNQREGEGMFWKKKKDSIFIELLKYGERAGLQGTTIPEMLKWAQTNGFSDSDIVRENSLLFRLYDECFVPGSESRGGHGLSVLRNEYFFRLVEYRELEMARKASREARWLSIAAIIISLFAITTSFQSIEIKPQQIDRIILAIPTTEQGKG